MRKYRIVKKYRAHCDDLRLAIQEKRHWFSFWKDFGLEYSYYQPVKNRIEELRLSALKDERERAYKMEVFNENQ